MSEKIINFGILGCGAIANLHARAVLSLPQANLVGVTDNNLENAKNFADKYSAKCYNSYEEMLSDSQIDAICICTPSGFHADNTLDALNAKKHVVLEKPMAFTTAKAREIMKAAEDNDRLVTVISQLRFAEATQKVRKMLADGVFGKIVFCDLYMKYWRSPEYYSSSNWRGTLKYDGGGALMNQGIHGIDIVLYLMGNAKVLASKNKTVFHNIEVEDASVSMVEFENGAMGVIEGSTCSNPGFKRRVEITGTKGSVALIEDQIEKLVIDGKTLIDGVGKFLTNTESNPMALEDNLHTAQIENFINAIMGKEKLVVDAYEGSRAISLIEQIYKLG